VTDPLAWTRTVADSQPPHAGQSAKEAQHPRAVSRFPQIPGGRIARLPATVGSADGKNPVPKAQLKSARIAHALITHIRNGIDRNDRRELRSLLQSHGVLSAAHVGGAEHPAFAVRPRLFRDPIGGVKTVMAIVRQEMPDAFRVVTAAGVLRHAGIAAGGEVIPKTL
jgi:hypothetical protein